MKFLATMQSTADWRPDPEKCPGEVAHTPE